MISSLPEFPEEHRSRLLGRVDRIKHLQRSESFDSSYTPSSLEGPEFKYSQLRCDIDREGHRTLAAHKRRNGKITYPGRPDCVMSNDHLYESYLRKGFCDSSYATSSRSSNDNLEESPSEAGALEYVHAAEKVSKPNDGLCKRCCMINIESLSEEEGYTHSKLDELEESARSCMLCRTLFDSCGDKVFEWTLDRYKMTLSLDISTRGKKARPDHFDISQWSWKCIWIGVFDMRPWQFPEGKKGRMLKISGTEWESVKPQLDEEVSVRTISMLCYTEEGDSAMDAGLPWLRKNIEYTGSSGSLNIARGWLKQCLADEQSGTNTGHETDNQDTESFNNENNYSLESLAKLPAERPTRLLEILPSSNPDRSHGHLVKLIETNDRDYTYAALSYCWGKIEGTTWLTKNDTLQQRMQDIDLEILPATIRDCLQIAPSLGVHHVWVDSLCIIQDSASDWETESAKMGGIYRGAILTIAASKSTSSAEGCYNQNKRSSPLNPFAEYTCVENRLRDGQTSRLYFEKMVISSIHTPEEGIFGTEVYGSPLSQRAWAYQEQVLSRRTLYFAASQLYWECDHCRLSQDNSQQAQEKRAYPVLTFSHPLSTSDVVAQWYRGAVEIYAKRGLTNPSDKLVAISAVAKATYLNRHVRYFAGLWQDCILPGLCWYRVGRGRKSTEYICPSWSWASQQSGVTYSALSKRYREPEEDASPAIQVLDVQVVPSEKNPFGNVQSGYVRLQTRVTAGTVMRDVFGNHGPGFNYYPAPGEQALVISEAGDRYVWQGTAMLDDEGHRGGKVMIALVNDLYIEKSKWLLLLLERAGDEHMYRRVGLGVLEEEYSVSTGEYRKPNFERDWTEQVITIL